VILDKKKKKKNKKTGQKEGRGKGFGILSGGGGQNKIPCLVYLYSQEKKRGGRH